MKSIKLFTSLALLLVIASGCASAVSSTVSPPAMTSMPAASDSTQAVGGGNVVEGPQTITIQNFAFTPPAITVNVGTAITWTNKDSTPHKVTADNGSFDSGILNQGESFTFQFNTPGTFPYICTIHPSMQATIIVVQ
jgi:plastocyanin